MDDDSAADSRRVVAAADNAAICIRGDAHRAAQPSPQVEGRRSVRARALHRLVRAARSGHYRRASMTMFAAASLRFEHLE